MTYEHSISSLLKLSVEKNRKNSKEQKEDAKGSLNCKWSAELRLANIILP